MASFGNTPYSNGGPPKVDGSSASASTSAQPEVYNCYMSKKYPKGSGADVKCFRTTVHVGQSQLYGSDITNALAISGVLIDSGAEANFISRDAVTALGFVVKHVRAKRFDLANGTFATHDQTAFMRLRMAGVATWVQAYVDDGLSSNILILGINGLRAFRLQLNAAFGTGKKVKTKVTIVDVEGGNLRRKIEVPEDKPGVGSHMWLVGPPPAASM